MRYFRFCLSLIFTFALSSNLAQQTVAQDIPPFVRSADKTIPTSSNPVDEPDKWLLAFIDIETTGLIPGWHEMIDIGIVLTDLDGNEISEFFARIHPHHPERLSDGAKAVNGFSVERWHQHSALSPAAAADSIAAFRNHAAAEKHVLFVAFNSAFDLAFMDHLFREQGRNWRELFHYMVLDVPSMAWAKGYHGLTGQRLAEAMRLPDEPRVADEHTGLTGARLNARIYNALRTKD